MTARRHPLGFAIVGLVLIAVGPGCGADRAATGGLPPAPPLREADWHYPGAAEVATVAGSDVTADDGRGGVRVVDRTPGFQVWTTTEPIATVYTFYAEKLGAAAAYEPGKTEATSRTPMTMTDTRGGITPMMTGSIAHGGRPDRSGVRTATLVKHDRSGDVVVILSRGDGEDVTTIEILTVGRASPDGTG